MRTRSRHACVILTSMAVATGTMGIRADLPVYEPFDYAVGSDLSSPLNGGTGFASPWTAPKDGRIVVCDETGYWDGKVDNVPTGPADGTRWAGAPARENRMNAQRVLSKNAGELAGQDGVLWASVVWRMDGYNYGRHVGLVLGTDGLRNRSQNCDKSGRHGAGLGNAIGVGGAINSGQVTPVIFTDGAVVARTTAGAATVNYRQDNLVILKFEFSPGTTPDRVSAWNFQENQTPNEATFETNAVSASFAIDESTLNILSFSQVQRGAEALDEIRIGDSFQEVVGLAPPPMGAGTLLYGD